MDFLKAQFNKIQEQLSGLTATQKMLVVSLLTIMVMTLLWWSKWAAEPEMSPLLDSQTLSTEDIGQISANLDAQGIPHEVVNNSVYVPADRKIEIMAVLGYSNALPRNFEDGFDGIIKEMNWLDPPDKTKEMFLRAKEQTLKSILRRMPGIVDAEVVIDASEERHIDDTDVQPVATVMITTDRNNRMDSHKLAEVAADMVCGAKAGLQRSAVRVAIDGQSIQLHDPSDDGTGGGDDDDAMAMQKQYEDLYQKKIEHALQDIDGVIVSVTVKVDTSVTMTTIHKIDPKQTVSVQTHSEETTEEQEAQTAAAEEPGAVPNTSMSLPSSSGGGGGGSTNTTEKNDFDVDHGKQDEVIKQGAGNAAVQAASVRIPRSYFLKTYKAENGGKDPDDPSALQTYINTQLAQIHDEVKGCAIFPTDDALYVGTFSDLAQPDLPVATESATSPLTGAIGKHGKEFGVAGLALVSLFMVSMMVRKGAPAPASAVTPPMAEDSGATISGNEAVVGSAAEDNASLDGMELDEDAVKAQRVVDQVQQMIESNPDSAANLVKRWLNR
jgi:flagellar M-ring protein FliF